MSRCIFHLDLDTFFVAVERLLDPALIGRPVIVSAGTARSVVAAASYEARTFGVHSAMPFVRAQKLCPQAVVCPGHFGEYQKYSRAFFDILENYSPDLEPASLDEGYLDYTACARLFGPALQVADEIQKRVKLELGLDVSLGLATSKTVAKIASDLAKPAGILYVLPGHEAAFLSPLPIRRLMGIGPKTEPHMQALGIKTIGDLARFLPEKLAERFGASAGWLQKAARGQDDSPVVKHGQPRSISHEETFALDRTDAGFLRNTLHELVCEVGYRLRRQGLKADTVCVKVRYADFSLHTRSQKLSGPTDLDRALFETSTKLLTDILARRVRIRLLGVGVQNLTDGGVQPWLLENQDRQRRENFQTAADHLRAQYGRQAARWASLLQPDENSRPEKARS